MLTCAFDHGRGAAALFAGEAGGHRWQRVPETEKRGRVHTSTITVAVPAITSDAKPGRSSTSSTSKTPPRAEPQVDLHLLEHEKLGVVAAFRGTDQHSQVEGSL